MARSVSPLDFTLAIKVLNLLSSTPGLNKKEIIELLNLKKESSKLDSVITDFNQFHLNLIRRETNKYYLNISKEKVPLEDSSQEKKNLFWHVTFINFALYIEVLQAFSFGNFVKDVSKFTGVSIVSTKEISSWGEMVGDLEKIKSDFYKVSIRSVEELLNRIAVCHLGLLGCTKIEREKQLEESGMKVDVYGLDRINNKEYFIESESSAKKLNEGIMQAHTWIATSTRNIEKWILIPKETLKEITFETLRKRYNTARNRNILIKLCSLNSTSISNFKIPSPKDLEVFRLIIEIIREKKHLNIEDLSSHVKNPKSYLKRIIRFGLIVKKQDQKYYFTFKI